MAKLINIKKAGMKVVSKWGELEFDAEGRCETTDEIAKWYVENIPAYSMEEAPKKKAAPKKRVAKKAEEPAPEPVAEPEAEKPKRKTKRKFKRS